MGDGVTKTDIATNQSDSLTLHHFDHPSLVLLSKLLEGNNYGQWSHIMRIALSTKNKLGFINGTINAPAKIDAKFPIWECCNHMIFSWILNSIHSDIAGSVIYAESAIDVWNDLHDRFSQGNDS
ncbi:hypothetical protein LWI29_023378 [Acer saccharum]|uniref:Retrotransposon Copia-like N-terminal domain-containing protein n=1 Tax=Acer saccharum TaxID=4024 RepID=A0AA39SEE4_ACESA|nr:hypothetical protein LWI29_023378 [Acer saccharum]